MSIQPSRKTQVLLVDDDRSLRRALERAIRVGGFEVEAFGSAEAMLAQGLPDADFCLVLDVDLPGIDGVELKRRLDAYGRDIPTIFITALAPDEVNERLGALSPVAVLYKPFNRNDLLAAIARASEQSKKTSYH